MSSRRFPPIASIRAVEAACRLGGFSMAAIELGVSQSAVSQSVRKLERQLGTAMFVRTAGSVRPTAAGEQYAQAVRPALAALQQAAAELEGKAAARPILGCSRALMMNWLVPQLGFAPQTIRSVELRALGLAPDLTGVDLAILRGDLTEPERGAVLLRREVLVAVGAPGLVAQMDGPLERQPQVDRELLLGGSWPLWAQLASWPKPPTASVSVTEVSTLVAAVKAGQGFGLLPWMVCSNSVSDGTLAVASDLHLDRARGYWLVQPAGGRPSEPLMAWVREAFASAPLPATYKDEDHV
ncbi:MAG: LysR family transcriptional regulator [Caulobacter sp.]